MATHRADAARLLDDRGYTGPLIRGQPPHHLLEEGVRNRITSSYYFKEQCFGVNEATLCDRAVALRYVGGTYADGLRATPFICLILKMLQLHLEREIVDEYLNAGGEDFKYLRALAAFYVRLTSETSEDVYKRLEPFLNDARKLRVRGNNGFRLTFMDEFVDSLLVKDRVCATSLWKLVPRETLEEEDKLEERVSPVQHLLDAELDGGSERSSVGSHSASRSRSRSYSHSPSPSNHRSSEDSAPNGRASDED